MRARIEAKLAELREIAAASVWHEKIDAQIEILEWVLVEIAKHEFEAACQSKIDFRVITGDHLADTAFEGKE